LAIPEHTGSEVKGRRARQLRSISETFVAHLSSFKVATNTLAFVLTLQLRVLILYYAETPLFPPLGGGFLFDLELKGLLNPPNRLFFFSFFCFPAIGDV
jgi:hypothetical protein